MLQPFQFQLFFFFFPRRNLQIKGRLEDDDLVVRLDECRDDAQDRFGAARMHGDLEIPVEGPVVQGRIDAGEGFREAR